MRKGTISVQAENIFPIIKKFLYSDQEIFLRELVSNAVDATTKAKALVSKGIIKDELGDIAIEIIIDKENKTLTIRDKGIGMSAEEVEKYLNQVAFSSAQEFLEKHKEESIIGHFGLGFYSAFMVAEKVEVKTKSFKEDSKGVTWICTGDTEYTIGDNDKAERGTDIILHIGSDSEEYLEDNKIEGLLTKYCKFLPIPIQFGTRTETFEVEAEEADSTPKAEEGAEKAEEKEGAEEQKTTQEIEVPNIINNTDPIWKKKPSELTDEDYKNFYQELYPNSQEPLFWIHLNIDYPFNLTGILYFPKLENSIEVQKNKIQLYSNQVYVTDEVKSIVPEFLTLLHGVIDSPDIPLNVSRSYLQSDRNVKQITGYITKKVAGKLADMFKKDRPDFESKWKDIGIFIKYGMITEDKFSSRAIKFCLLKSIIEDKLFTLDEYKEKIGENQKDKHDKLVGIYAPNDTDFDSFVQEAKACEYDVVLMDAVIDNHYLQHLEQKDGNLTFVRVDSDTADNLVQKEDKKESVLGEDDQNTVKSLFEGQIQDKNASVQLKAMLPGQFPVIVTKPEFMRRFKEMSNMQGSGMEAFGDMYNLVVNSNHPLIADRLLKIEDSNEQQELVKHLCNLALLNQGMLRGADLTAFVNKSLKMV